MKKQAKTLVQACMNTIQVRSFANAYNKTFELMRCDTEELKNHSFRLRHKVYREEHGITNPLETGETDPYLEYDQYDDRAVHFILRHKQSNEIAATLRIILPDDEKPGESFPVQSLCDYPSLQSDSRALTMCELSRFCMAPRFRRRNTDGKFLPSYQHQDMQLNLSDGKISYIRRRISYAPAALLSGAFEAAMDARILDCVWMVEPAHLWSLDMIGIPYRSLGDSVEEHGGLKPVIFNIKHALDTMRTRHPACWEIISDGGRLQDMADSLSENDWVDTLICDDLV